jgi:hypothetical protein
MSEQSATPTRRTGLIIGGIVLAVVALVVIAGFIVPSITGGDNLVDVFNVIRGK